MSDKCGGSHVSLPGVKKARGQRFTLSVLNGKPRLDQASFVWNKYASTKKPTPGRLGSGCWYSEQQGRMTEDENRPQGGLMIEVE